MPKNVNDVNKRSTQTPQQCRSVGLAAYWKRMRCEAAEETNHPSGTEKLGYVAEDGALTERLEGSSKSVKGVKMINTETFDGQDAYVGVGVARSVEYCKSGIQNTPLFPSTSAVKGIISECHFAGEGGSNDPTKWMRALSFGKDIHFGSNPFLNTTPHIVENGGKLVVDKGKAAVSAVPTPSQTGKRILEHVECHEDLVSEKQMPSYTQPHNLVNACRKVNILSGHYSKAYNWGKFTKVQMPVGMSRSCSEIFNTKPYAGSNFTALNKAFNVESNTGKVGHMKPSNLPPLPGAATSSNKSREAEKLLQHGKQPDLSNADPGNRSLKRLKLNSTPSAQGTRCSNFASPLLLPPLPGAATSSEKSREVEKLLLHGEQPHLPNADPGNRLLKRLKLNSSTPLAQGTTSSLKISKLYGGIPRSSTTSSAPNKPREATWQEASVVG